MKKEKTGGSGLTARQLASCALMAVVLCLCSWLTVPAPVPFTMQTFAVFSALLLLGGRLGGISVTVYVLLGAAGLPVFSGFTGGVGRLLGPTGGYIAGFLLMAAVYRLLERRSGGSRFRAALSLALGLLACYAFGTVWFVIVYAMDGGTISLGAALSMCVVPFVVPDMLKLALAIWLSGAVGKHLKIR